jgi:predicted proteasome-type protease
LTKTEDELIKGINILRENRYLRKLSKVQENTIKKLYQQLNNPLSKIDIKPLSNYVKDYKPIIIRNYESDTLNGEKLDEFATEFLIRAFLRRSIPSFIGLPLEYAKNIKRDDENIPELLPTKKKVKVIEKSEKKKANIRKSKNKIERLPSEPISRMEKFA